MKRIIALLCLLACSVYGYPVNHMADELFIAEPTVASNPATKGYADNLLTNTLPLDPNTNQFSMLLHFGGASTNNTNAYWSPINMSGAVAWNASTNFLMLPAATNLTSSAQTFIVPAGVYLLYAKGFGGGGGGVSAALAGGDGGTAVSVFDVVPGGTCTIYVAQGGASTQGNWVVARKAWPGGGQATSLSNAASIANGGGAYSAVYYNEALKMVAAGGGGGGQAGGSGGIGGKGGSLVGQNGTIDAPYYGSGGSQAAGGAGGNGMPVGATGSSLQGGDASLPSAIASYMSAGGGGYYGGGAANTQRSGGGGSCFAVGRYSWTFRGYDSSDPDWQAGVAVGGVSVSIAGPGLVVIKWNITP